MERRQLRALLPLVVAACLVAYSAMANVPEPPRERLFDETLSWSSDELSRIRQLKERDLENKTAFLESSSVADFLGLHHVDAVHMPIPLSIVLIGFSGDGNLGVNLSLAQVQKWFGHLDHVLPHSRIELAELSCTEDGQCTGLVHGHAPNTQPVHSTVHLNFSCNAVLVKQRSVVAAFERAVHAFGRPVDIDVESGTQQVDAVKMEAFVDHFVTSLGLSSHYTLVVLNPSWSSSEAAYGYRAGLSQSEIDVVVREKAEVMRLLQTTGDAEPSLGPADAGRAWGDVGWRRPAQPALDSKFATNDMTWRSNEWASRANEYLGQEEAFREKMTKSIRGARKGVGAMVHGARVLRRLTGHLGTTMRYEVMGDTAYTHAKLRSRFATHHPATDCLVGNWVSTKQRWLLLDLSATAGSEWGPAMGGDGVVHEHTVPRVATYFGPLADKRKLMRKAARVEGSVDHEMQKKLSAEKTDTLARTSKEEYAAFVARRKEWDEARKSGEGDSGASVKDELEKWGKTYRQALARAELDMFEKFALRHCHNQAPPLPLCADIKDDVSRLRSQLSKLVVSLGTPDNNSSDGSDDSGGCGGSGGLFPSHMWDIFGAGAALPHVEAGDVGEAASRARDFFTADLVSVLSRGLRHVVAPPTAVWRHGTGGAGSGSGGKMDGQWVRHDIAMPFASRVTFQVTLISESTKVRTHSETALFDIKAFEHQVRRLALTNPAGTHSAQAFDFKVRTHQLSSEPDLAAAFAVSLRSAYHAISDGSAAFGTGAEVLYVDSRELQHHVRSALAARSEWPVRERAPGHTVVPVLIFQLDRDAAVLIDQHYNAKALEDMILVVHNAARFAEHPTGMMCGGALLARPLTPLKGALAAVLTYLGGVLPPHLGYNPARKTVIHDWLWSVGAHPMSATSMGVEYTEMQRDALGRSYLLDALDSTIELVNGAIGALASVRASHAMHTRLVRAKAGVRAMLAEYAAVVQLWRTIVGHAYALDFASGVHHIADLREHSEAFTRMARELAGGGAGLGRSGRAAECRAMGIGSGAGSVLLPHAMMAGSAVLAAGALIYALGPSFARARRGMRTRGLALRR